MFFWAYAPALTRIAMATGPAGVAADCRLVPSFLEKTDVQNICAARLPRRRSGRGAGRHPLPKLGDNAAPVTAATDHLQQNPAPDHWAFSAFVKPQNTASAGPIAAVTAAVDGFAGLPALAEDTVLTQPALQDLVGLED